MAAIEKKTMRLTREGSNMSNYEGYHGDETASVPFTWESQPGTPKVKFRDSPLPPLTPPPSYTYSVNKPHNNKSSSSSSSSKPNLFQSIFPKRTARKAGVLQRPPPSPATASPAFSFSSSTSSCSSSSYNSRSASPALLRSRSVPSSPVRRQRKKEEEDVDVSGLCFGNAGSRGCYFSMIKKLLLRDFV